MWLKSMQIRGSGLDKYLGELELAIMEILWSEPKDLSARKVTQALQSSREVSFNAVSTVLNRLVVKGLIEKVAHGKRYSFRAVMDKKTLAQSALKDSLSALLEDKALLTAAGFTGPEEVKYSDQDLLHRLEKFIKE